MLLIYTLTSAHLYVSCTYLKVISYKLHRQKYEIKFLFNQVVFLQAYTLMLVASSRKVLSKIWYSFFVSRAVKELSVVHSKFTVMLVLYDDT